MTTHQADNRAEDRAEDQAASPTASEGAPTTGRDISSLPTPLYAEDLAVGDWMELGELSMTEAEIIEFATLYDPLPIHTDPEAAAQGPFGGIIASAVQTFALFARLTSSTFLSRLALVAGKGMDNVRFPAPVRPGEVLRVRLVLEQVVLKEGRADLHCRATVSSDTGTVLSLVTIPVVRRRP